MKKNMFLRIVVGVVSSASFILSGCADVTEAKPVSVVKKPVMPVKAVHKRKSYCIKGKRYYIQPHYTLTEEGIASHYGDRDGFHGGPTASGQRFDKNSMTAAHKTLPLRCFIRVENLENGKSVVLFVNNRGPFRNGRILDVSSMAAKKLGFHRKGLARIRLTCLGKVLPKTFSADKKAPSVISFKKKAPKTVAFKKA